MNDSTVFGATLGVLVLVAVLAWSAGHDTGRREVQRERLTERGCEPIAREPELWECDGERIEVQP